MVPKKEFPVFVTKCLQLKQAVTILAKVNAFRQPFIHLSFFLFRNCGTFIESNYNSLCLF